MKRDGAKAESKHMMFARAVKKFFSPLDEFAHPAPDEVADERHSHTYDEHIEA